jgi:signal transduction histidine kinase
VRSTLFTFCAVVGLIAAATAVRASWADPQAGRPVMRVFGPSDYGSTARNWCVLRDRRGRLVVGNDSVHVFDGRTWSHLDLKAYAPVRSLEAGEDGRVWVAANGDYGYLEEDSAGKYRFFSLKHFAPPDASANAWAVFLEGECTVFVMIDSVVVWDGARSDVFPLPNQNRLFSFRFRGGVAIAQDDALLLWRARRLERIDPPGLERVRWGFQCRDGSELVRVRGGLCRLTEGGPVLLPRESTEEMHRGLETGAIRISDELLCVTTATSGLFVLAEDGSIVRRLSRENGLPSQACERAYLDPEDGLWLPTDRAVVRLDAHNTASRFDAGNGLGGGTVTVLTATHESMIALTDEVASRLMTAPARRPTFTPLPGQQYGFKDAEDLGDRILLGGLRALVSHRPGEEDILVQLPSTVFRVVRAPSRPGIVIASAGGQILEVDARVGLRATDRVLGVIETGAMDLSFDGDGTLWAAQYQRWLFSIRHDELETGARRLEPIDTAPGNLADPRLFSLGGTVYAYNSEEVWRLPRRGEAAPRRELAGLGLFAAERMGGADVWAVARRGGDTRLVRIEPGRDGALTAVPVACPGLETLGQVKAAARDFEGRALWLGGFNGALRLDLGEARIEPPPPAPHILRVERRVAEEPGTLLPLAGGVEVDFHGGAALAFDLRDGADVLGSAARLQARLVGRETEWAGTGLVRTYTSLREGRYELQARAVDLLGRTSPVARYAFTVLPPWFRTGWAYAGYVLLGLTVVAGSAQLWALRIKRRNLQLEQIVKQRTEELTRAITARTAFLANMGHEIRNPLNGVVGLVEMLRAGDQDAEQGRKTVERLGACADQLVSVVEDVLEFSRVDAGRISVRPRPFVVREPVEAAVDIFRAAEPDRAIAVEAAAAELVQRVVGDPVRIRQVLVNYLANALKFAPLSPVTVGVEKRGDSFVFSVADQGPGIPRDQQARLFIRFSRGTFAHREGIPGTGLGLAACKAYAEAMGGEVWVESEPGHGAAFCLRVPLRAAVDGEMLPAAIVPDIMAGRTALVVDDHEFNRLVLTDLLGRMGATATAVPDVARAREAFAAAVPDVVFVDFDLPGETGADLARWIRAKAPAGRDVPVVATSAFEVEEIRQRCAEAGMDAFIAKPVTAHKVAETMSRIEAIRTGGAGPEPPAAPASTPGLAPGAGFLDLLSDGDPARRRELEKSAWREVHGEASAALRQTKRGNLAEAGRHAHRLTSAAVMLGLQDIVAVSKKLTGAARAGDGPGAAEAAAALRQALVAAKRQRGGGR